MCLACSFLSIRAELHNEDDRVQLQVGAEALKMRVMQLHPCEAPAEDTQEWFFYSERNRVESNITRDRLSIMLCQSLLFCITFVAPTVCLLYCLENSLFFCPPRESTRCSWWHLGWPLCGLVCDSFLWFRYQVMKSGMTPFWGKNRNVQGRNVSLMN